MAEKTMNEKEKYLDEIEDKIRTQRLSWTSERRNH